MNARVGLTGLLSVVCLGTLWGVIAQRQRLSAMQREEQRLLAQFTAAAQPAAASEATDATSNPAIGRPAVVPASAELLRLRSEVHRLTERRRELSGVRLENEQLRAQLASRGTNAASGSGLGPGYVRKAQARMVGYNTPEDTIQSFLWAMQNHDLTNLLQAFTPVAAQQMQATVQESGRSVEEFFQGTDAFVGLGVRSREQLPDGAMVVTLEVAPGIPPQEVRFERINGQWKMARPP